LSMCLNGVTISSMSMSASTARGNSVLCAGARAECVHSPWRHGRWSAYAPSWKWPFGQDMAPAAKHCGSPRTWACTAAAVADSAGGVAGRHRRSQLAHRSRSMQSMHRSPAPTHLQIFGN
jgi:hypothetical protein